MNNENIECLMLRFTRNEMERVCKHWRKRKENNIM